MQKIWVTKASGKKQLFQLKKIERTCRRSGAGDQLTKQVLSTVKENLYPGISTREILKIVLEQLGKRKSDVASRYGLKQSIMKLGPAGFVFEKLVAKILEEYGWTTQFPPLLQGECVKHEIDIIARKQQRKIMIECKYRNQPGIYIGLQIAMYTWARYLDLRAGYQLKRCPQFKEAFLITNTKFSKEAIQYANCKKMKLMGWNYPADKNLKNLLEAKKLYPVTVLRTISKLDLKKLSQAELIFCRDLLERDVNRLASLTSLTRQKIRKIQAEARDIVNFVK